MGLVLGGSLAHGVALSSEVGLRLYVLKKFTTHSTYSRSVIGVVHMVE
jgi:hypothetical protein